MSPSEDGGDRPADPPESDSSTEIEFRIGLGWEVWFLIGLVGLAGLAMAVTVLVVGAGLDPVASARHPGTGAAVDPRRVLAGGIGALTLALSAAAVAATTEWRTTDARIDDEDRVRSRAGSPSPGPSGRPVPPDRDPPAVPPVP